MAVSVFMFMNVRTMAQTPAGNTAGEGRVLVAYFSATGTTKSVAEKMARAVGGDLYAITPEKPYTSADLNWHNDRSRSSLEMNDPAARPAIAGKPLNVKDYDVVFIGYPIWWGVAPRVVNTFIESVNLEGKTVIPFATSGGSGISSSVSALRSAYPKINWQSGRLLNSERDMREWLSAMGY